MLWERGVVVELLDRGTDVGGAGMIYSDFDELFSELLYQNIVVSLV